MNRVSGHYLSCIIEACSALGLSQNNLTESCNIPKIDLADPIQRFEGKYLLNLYANAAILLKESNIGLIIGSKFNTSWLNETGKLLPFCATLGEVGLMMGRYHRLTQSFGTSQVRVTEQDVWLQWKPNYHNHEDYKHVIEAIFTGMTLATRWLLWNEGPAVKYVQFAHSPHGNLEAYQDVLECPVYFDRDFDAIGIDRAYLNFPLVTKNAELKTELSRKLDRLLLRLDDETALIARVEASIREQLHDTGPIFSQTAQHLDVSERKLRYKLKRLSTNFRKILESVRRELCDVEMRKRTQISIIAHKLGYHDQSAFNHAFHKWHGMSPREYQANHSAARGAK